LNRLSDATSNYGDIDYAYDAIGNRISETVDTVAETYSYEVNSHHLSQTQNGTTVSYTYDANGNTTDNTDGQFSYGDNNRLKEASISGNTLATYTYNGRGERVKKDGNTLTYYYYNQGGQLIAETDATGNTLTEYIYSDVQPIALIENSNINYIHTDHLGTPQQISDDSQTVVWKADYNPFGEATVTTQTITNNLRFPGQYYDEETGLHYNLNRYYDPQLGRYITSDPIGLQGGLNTYGYALQNPIIIFDPTGGSFVVGAVCFSLTLGVFSDDIRDITEALEDANEAFDKIKELEVERDSCNDDARITEINKEISDLTFEYGGSRIKETAKGFGIGVLATIAGAICGSIPAP
jgi:RHS repeat-associated protein